MKVAIIGGGIVGLATAFELLQRFPHLHLLLLEKESGPGRHQTGHNSGVLHCGLYYKPGSAKARLAVQGIRRMVEFCAQHDIPHELCGTIVLATDVSELPALHALLERGRANGLDGLQLLSREQIAEFEPHAAGVAALRVPQEEIVDYTAAADTMAREIQTRGGEIAFSAEVTGLKNASSGWKIQTTRGEFQADFIINCAGLHCDRLSHKAGIRDPTRIVPFRGEYYRLTPGREHLVRNLIYPVPDSRFPFLGVHFTRLIHGGIEAGPNAVLAFAREGYRASDFSVRDMIDTLTCRGFWRFLLRYPSLCWNEFRRTANISSACRCSDLCRISASRTSLREAPECVRKRFRLRANWCRTSILYAGTASCTC
jgi:L-2-hydroxyglutarate oxidase LhgO